MRCAYTCGVQITCRLETVGNHRIPQITITILSALCIFHMFFYRCDEYTYLFFTFRARFVTWLKNAVWTKNDNIFHSKISLILYALL